MTIEQRIDALKDLEYPSRVDVVDKVMSEVRRTPKAKKHNTVALWRIAGGVAAAAAVALVVLNVAIFPPHQYDEEGLGSMIAQVNDLDSYSSWGTIEEAAFDVTDYIDDQL